MRNGESGFGSELWTGRLVQVRTQKYKPKPENYFEAQIMPSQKTESLVRSEKLSNVAKLFWLYFCARNTKSTS